MSRGRNTESGGAQGARRATEAAPDSARRGKGRWSARRRRCGSSGKAERVLRSLSAVSTAHYTRGFPDGGAREFDANGKDSTKV